MTGQAPVYGPPPPPASGGFGGLSSAGSFLALSGALIGAVGSFYSAKSAKNELKSEALSADFAASMANLNARNAELEAQAILRAGEQQEGVIGLAGAQAKAGARVSAAAAGIEGGGSAAEVQAGLEWVKQVDMLTTRANTVRAAGAARLSAVEQRNRASLLRVSAGNLRGTARSISPGLAGFTSLIGGASQVASKWSASSGAY